MLPHDSSASKSPDFEWKSPDFLPKTMLARSIASFAIFSSRRNDFQFDEFCFKPFANCVVIEKIQGVWFSTPGRCHIRRDTVIQHARAWEAWLLRCVWPSLGLIRSLATKASEEGVFPEIRHCCIFYRFFRTMSDNIAKQMKGFWKETTESAPIPQFSTNGHREA